MRVCTSCDILLLSFSNSKLLFSFHFQNGKYFGLSYGKLIAAVSTSVYLLSPVPLKEQVNMIILNCY